MKKRIRFVALLLVACMTFMLAGCDLFGQNAASYLNQVVITATYNDGTLIEIKREEYLNAYNNYGSQLMNSNGYTAEKAKEATINALVNRKILLGEAKADENVALEVEENLSELYYQTYEAMLSNVKGYEEQIRKDWEMEAPDTMAEETKTGTVYNAYKKQAEVVYVANPKYVSTNFNGKYDEGEKFVDSNENGQYDAGEQYTDTNGEEKGSYKIKKIEDTTKPVRDREFASLEQVKNVFYAETKNNTVNTFASEGYRRLLGSLRASQKTLKTNYSDDKLIENEIERIFKNLEENEYISVYQEQQQFNGGYSTITVQQVLNKYASMMSESKFIYDNNNETYKTDMLENFKNVNYVVNDEYFHVAHILLKFSDEQQAEFDSLKDLSNNGAGGVVSPEYAAKRKQELYNSIMGSVRDLETGEIVANDSVTAENVLKEIQTELNSATTNAQKDEAFRKLMYKYNEDDGIMNADYSYIIGLNDSKMVENFTNSSRELNQNGVYGGISGLVQTEYGVHIIYYMGKCENLFEFNEDGSLKLSDYYTVEQNGTEVETSDVLKLAETKLNNLNNKTIFDLVYEGLVEDKYSEFENINLETIKHEKGIQVKVSDKL